MVAVLAGPSLKVLFESLNGRCVNAVFPVLAILQILAYICSNGAIFNGEMQLSRTIQKFFLDNIEVFYFENLISFNCSTVRILVTLEN